MSYKIPGADFTESDKLQVNVADSLGTSFSNALTSFTKAWQANARETKKLKQVEDDFTDQIVIANNAVANQTIQAGLDSGKFKKGTTIFEQWSEEVIRRGNLATQARIDMRFGDLDADEKKKKLDIINSFTNYNTSSLKNMGRYANDINLYNSKEKNKQYLTGDMSNGEYMNNIVTMTAANGVDAEKQFGKGATSERNLIVDGDTNIISSSVSIPKNNDFIKNMKTGSSAFNDVIATGLENGNIIDDGNGNYVFKSKINMSVYGTEGGPDFLVNYSDAIDQNAVLKRANFVNDKGEIADTSYLGNNKEGFESYKTTANTGNNNLQTTELEVLDIGTLLGNDSFKTDMAAEVNTLLRPGRSARAIASDIANNYTTGDIASFYKAFPGLKKYTSFEELYASTDADLKKNITTNIIREHMFDNIFKFQKSTGNKDGVSFISRELHATKDKKLIEYLNSNNAKNSLGKDYKAGDMIYGREIIESEKIVKEPSKNMYGKILDQIKEDGTNFADVFGAAVPIPGSKERFIKYDKDGAYIVDEDGLKADDNAIALTYEGVSNLLGRGTK
jgi:hypothetical protein